MSRCFIPVNQATFIHNWNKIVDLLKKHDKKFHDYPKLTNDGACCGFAFLLADYVREDSQEEFFQIFNDICENSPNDIAQLFIKDAGSSTEDEALERYLDSLIDFIMKVVVLQEKQNKLLGENKLLDGNELLSETQKSILTGSVIANHARIESQIDAFDTQTCGYISRDFTKKLKLQINTLKNNDSLQYNFYSKYIGDGAHSILLYKANNKFFIFDPNDDRNIEVENANDAAKEVMRALNCYGTSGEFKYTYLDKFIHFVKNEYKQFLTDSFFTQIYKGIFVVAISPVIALSSFVLLVSDVLVENRIPDDQLMTNPVHDGLMICYGKIKAMEKAVEAEVSSNVFLTLFQRPKPQRDPLVEPAIYKKSDIDGETEYEYNEGSTDSEFKSSDEDDIDAALYSKKFEL